MNCPVCKTEPMIVLELDQIEVDYCLACKGIWLDSGELEMLLENSQNPDELLNGFTEVDRHNEELHKCPICLKKMQKISVGEKDKEIIIDKCKKNHGLWFDKGELGEILEKATLDKDHKIQKLLAEIFGQTN